MGIYSYGYKAAKTPIGKKVVDTVKNIFTGGKQKTTGTEVIKSVNPNVPVTKGQKLKRDLKLATQKRKASEARLDSTIFRINQQKKRLEEMKTGPGSANPKRPGKMGGGFMGKRMGYSQGSSKGKVPTTPKEKAFGMLSVNKGLDNNKNITFTDKIAGATGSKKKKKKA